MKNAHTALQHALIFAALADTNADHLAIREPHIGDGTLCHIFSHGIGNERVHCAPEGEPPAPGNTQPEKTFTQADLDRIVGQRVGEATKKFADFDTFKAQAAKVSEIEAELTKLREEKEMAGKSAEEQQRIAAERAAKALDRERSDWNTKLTAAEQGRAEYEKKYRDVVISHGLGSLLDGAKVLSSARDFAIKAFRDSSTVELDDSGKVVSITYNGVAYTKTSEAAAAFLKDNEFLASAGTAVGGGTKPPNGGGAAGAQNLFDRSPEELLRLSAQQRR